MQHRKQWLSILLVLILAAAFTVGCTSKSTDESEHEAEHSAEEGVEIVPNNGVTVRITSPADGAIFKAGEDIVVEVAFENFALGASGNHWHILVDGAEYTMVTGVATSEVLKGIQAGKHEIAVAMSNSNHQELEDGDMVMIEVQP